MSSSSASASSSSTVPPVAVAVPQVSEHFPRVPKGCEQVAEKFFGCFYEHGKQPQGVSDPNHGNKALVHCKDSLAAYNKCVDEAAKKHPKEIFRVSEAYRLRE